MYHNCVKICQESRKYDYVFLDYHADYQSLNGYIPRVPSFMLNAFEVRFDPILYAVPF